MSPTTPIQMNARSGKKLLEIGIGEVGLPFDHFNLEERPVIRPSVTLSLADGNKFQEVAYRRQTRP